MKTTFNQLARIQYKEQWVRSEYRNKIVQNNLIKVYFSLFVRIECETTLMEWSWLLIFLLIIGNSFTHWVGHTYIHQLIILCDDTQMKITLFGNTHIYIERGSIFIIYMVFLTVTI